jgi:hypothetical protein
MSTPSHGANPVVDNLETSYDVGATLTSLNTLTAAENPKRRETNPNQPRDALADQIITPELRY